MRNGKELGDQNYDAITIDLSQIFLYTIFLDIDELFNVVVDGSKCQKVFEAARLGILVVGLLIFFLFDGGFDKTLMHKNIILSNRFNHPDTKVLCPLLAILVIGRKPN